MKIVQSVHSATLKPELKIIGKIIKQNTKYKQRKKRRMMEMTRNFLQEIQTAF